MGLNPLGRRRHYIVQRKLQERFTSILLVQMTFILLLIAGLAYYWNLQQRKILLPAIGTPDAEVVYEGMQWFLIKTILLIGAAALLFILTGIWASHKIAGPVYKMMHHLSLIKEGRFDQKIAFRKGDRLEDLAQAFNEATDSLSREQALRMEQLALAEGKLHQVESLVSEASVDAASALPALEDMKVVLARIDRAET